VIRTKSVFILHEHDLKLGFQSDSGNSKMLYPMLGLSHSVFNGIEGVPINDEIEEVRAFRPIIEWRQVLDYWTL